MKPHLNYAAVLIGLAATQNLAHALDACDRQDLAEKIRDNPRIYLSTTHPSGVVDSANARQNIVDTANGKQAKRSSYGTAPGGSVWLDPRMLNCMDRLEQVYGYSYSVSELAGASHSAGSHHYGGRAVDIYTINGSGVSSGNPYWSTFLQRCRDHGATETLGPGYPGHDTHVHAAWTDNGQNVAPSGCINGKQNIHVFGRGADGACWIRSWYAGDGWNNWYSLGGSIDGGPDAYSKNDNHVGVVVRSASEPGHIKARVWTASSGWDTWSDLWTSVGGNMTSDPSAVARSASTWHVSARGSDGAAWLRTHTDGSGWAQWYSLGGNINGAPDLYSKSSGHLGVAVLSETEPGHIKAKVWTSSGGWGGWSDLWTSTGGNMDSAPSAVVRGDSTVHIFARKGSSCWIRTHTDSGGWGEWYSLGAPTGGMVNAPDSYSRGADNVAVVVRNANNRCYKKTWSANTGWGFWEDIGQPSTGLTSSPGAVAR